MPNFESKIISAIQAALGVDVDGKAGPETWGAIHDRLVGGIKLKDSISEASVIGRVDSRSEVTITNLQPEVRPYARLLVQKAAAAGITIRIISGLRTYEEQDALYAKGRTAAGNKVTNAKGGQSNHNFGIAFDVGVFEGGQYMGESPMYKTVGALGVDIGLEWGGNWKTIKDQPHFQLRPVWAKTLPEKEMLAGLRMRKQIGKPFYDAILVS